MNFQALKNSAEFTKELKLGWNLGNTLDAPDGETTWGQPFTTPEMLDIIKREGFTTLRLPVSWHKHVDENLKLDEKFLSRVYEVVEHALDIGLFVILNSHHDDRAYYPSSDAFEKSGAYIKAIWEQISERFNCFDEHLIFESMNEPRLVGTKNEWWFDPNNEECIDSINCINALNELFVKTVRSTKSNNENRYLLVPGYAASPDSALSDFFKRPDDSKVIVSIHAYAPYNFALNTTGTDKWDINNPEDTDPIVKMMDRAVEKYISRGIGVVIGEFGAVNKNNTETRNKWAEFYTSNAKERGIPCVWWDNNLFESGNEKFGLLDRKNLKIYYPTVLKALLEGYK